MKRISHWLYGSLAIVCMAGSPFTRNASSASPFVVTASLESGPPKTVALFKFEVPPEHKLYVDRLKFETEEGGNLTAVITNRPAEYVDSDGEKKQIYNSPFAARVALESALPLTVIVRFQGCSNAACYFPEKHSFVVSANGIRPQLDGETAVHNSAGSSPQISTNGFRIVAVETGYLPKSEFVAFLEAARTGTPRRTGIFARLGEFGIGVTLLLIVVGGLGLNLTPCVLPLIPINLAIIGAGARASSRMRGFTLGAVYGAGMALVYGVLGLVVVLTGSKFGTLNSSAWFNAGIALVFVIMALAMFDLINIDFSRFQGNIGAAPAKSNSQFVVAFTIGVLAALLAGACVAPVVISVLLLATNLYAKGVVLGLLLPFLLGVGMALPWPFAGAGLSFLPKPGKWMKSMKYGFGVLILLFATYYGHLAVMLYRAQPQIQARTGAEQELSDRQPSAEQGPVALAEGMERGKAERRPVLIDFGASWCKNCLAMDSSVFPTAEVQAQLKNFVVVRYDAEKPNESPAREVLDQFAVLGLPTYVVLLPDGLNAAQTTRLKE